MGHDDSRTQYSILITLRAGRKKNGTVQTLQYSKDSDSQKRTLPFKDASLVQSQLLS